MAGYDIQYRLGDRDVKSKIFHYKIIHGLYRLYKLYRYYYTPLKLFSMGLIQERNSWIFKEEIGTFIHAI